MAAGRLIATGALFAACFAAGVLVPRAAVPQEETHNNAGRTANMTAVTGEVLRDVSALYVMDHETKRVAVYHAIGGQDLQFVGVRNARYDLELRAFRDRSETAVDVRVLRELFRRAVAGGEIEPGGKPR
jgi:hypothetical protein